MRRVALLPVLALVAVPAVAQAQLPSELPSQQPGAQGTGDGTVAGEPGGPSTPSAPSAPSSTSLPSAESTPAAPAAEEPAQGALRPTPPPENLESRTTPILELHGYLRTRFELFHNFSLGWEQLAQPAGSNMTIPTDEMTYNNALLPWYRNPDIGAQWCDAPPAMGAPMARAGSCTNATQTSANMRLRLNPEIHPTEFIAVHSQVDVLDNLVLGSTPEGYHVRNGDAASPYAPITGLSNTQLPPVAGYNGFINSIHVRRAWAEVTNPNLGQVRFGRMPSHWGLGLFHNAGNRLDSDYQTTVDRVMYAARFRPIGIFLAAMWDFPSTGPTSMNPRANGWWEPGHGQPHDLSQFDDLHQWSVALGRRLDPDAQRTALSRDEWVVNGGLFITYRSQFLTLEGLNTPGDCATSPGAMRCTSALERRDMNVLIPDLWVQVMRRNFRFEAEAVYMRGTIGNIRTGGGFEGPYTISQFGAAAEAEYRLLNNRLGIQFRTGYASGDADQEGLNHFNGLQSQPADRSRTLSTFRFHPDYRIDLIFWRQIMRQVSAAYYLRPSVQYNFIDEPNGDLFFGRVDLIWSRASEFIQTRGNHADLGVEIDATLQYQSNHRRPDGTEPVRPVPGFYARLQYGVFFPLGGLGPTDAERMNTASTLSRIQLQTAQTLRGVLGVQF